MQGTRGQSGCAELQNTPILLVAACCGALLEQAAALGPCMAAATPRCATPRCATTEASIVAPFLCNRTAAFTQELLAVLVSQQQSLLPLKAPDLRNRCYQQETPWSQSQAAHLGLKHIVPPHLGCCPVQPAVAVGQCVQVVMVATANKACHWDALRQARVQHLQSNSKDHMKVLRILHDSN